jgi:hypothetical protein
MPSEFARFARERRPLVADGVSAIQPSAAVRRVRAEFRYYRLDEHSNSKSCPQQPGIQKARSSGREGKMSHLVHNEQMKLAANLFNNLAVVSLASGILVPIFSTRTSATPISFSEGVRYFRRALHKYSWFHISRSCLLCPVRSSCSKLFGEVKGVKTGRTARAFMLASSFGLAGIRAPLLTLSAVLPSGRPMFCLPAV